VVESVEIGSDRKGRATVKLSRGPLGEEIFRDIQDGIRRNVSVGYMVHEMRLEEQADDIDTYRVTDWEPMEISMVSIPADTAAQVGRSADPQPQLEGNTMPDEIRNEDEHQAEDGLTNEERANEILTVDRDPIDARIREIGKRFDMNAEAEDYIALDSTVEEFQEAVRKAKKERLVPGPSVPNDTRLEIRNPRRRSKLRAFENNRQGEEDAYRAGMWAQAVIYGNEKALRWCKDYGVRVMTGTSSTTSSIVPDEMVLPIIDLRERYGVARQRCYVHPMSGDTAIVPRRSSGVTAYFVGREDATSESDAGFDDIMLTAREVAALTRLSRSYVADAAIELGDHIANEMAYAFAVKEDDCLFNGDGTSTYGGIMGIRPSIIDGTHTVGAVDAASGHDTFAEIDHDDLVSLTGVLPEFPGINPSWYISKRGNSLTFDALKVAGGGNTISDFAGRPNMQYLGDEIVITQSMPKVVTDLSNLAMILYGDLNMGVTFGDRQGFEIEVLRERYAEYRQIGIQAVERFDINVHSLGDTSDAGAIVALIGE